MCLCTNRQPNTSFTHQTYFSVLQVTLCIHEKPYYSPTCFLSWHHLYLMTLAQMSLWHLKQVAAGEKQNCVNSGIPKLSSHAIPLTPFQVQPGTELGMWYSNLGVWLLSPHIHLVCARLLSKHIQLHAQRRSIVLYSNLWFSFSSYMLHFTYTLGIHAENIIGKMLQSSGTLDKCSMSFNTADRMQSVCFVWRCWLLARWCGKEGVRKEGSEGRREGVREGGTRSKLYCVCHLTFCEVHVPVWTHTACVQGLFAHSHISTALVMTFLVCVCVCVWVGGGWAREAE